MARFLFWLLAGWNHQHASTHADAQKAKDAHTHRGSVVNTGAQAVPLPRSSLWHTDWLIVWWACLWHTDCAMLSPERDRLSLRPPPPPVPHTGRPPLVSMQFLAERGAPLPAPLPPLVWRMATRMRGKKESRTGRGCVEGRGRWSHSQIWETWTSFFCCCFVCFFTLFFFLHLLILFHRPRHLHSFYFSLTLVSLCAAINPWKKCFPSLSIRSIQTSVCWINWARVSTHQ